jgi:hypothetical protein
MLTHELSIISVLISTFSWFACLKLVEQYILNDNTIYKLYHCGNVESEDLFKKSTKIISILNTLHFFITGNINVMLGYYIHDTFNCYLMKDTFMIIHHLVSVYMISVSRQDVDYASIINGLYLSKVADLCMHITHVSNIFYYDLDVYYYNKYFMQIITLVVWMISRVALPFFICYPFNNYDSRFFGIAIHFANFLWVFVLFSEARDVLNKINEQKTKKRMS